MIDFVDIYEFSKKSDHEKHNICKQMLDHLSSNGIIFAPTDTVFGIFSFNKSDICRIKNRSQDMPCQILGSKQYFLSLINPNPNSKLAKLTKAFWPGQLSIICNSSIEKQCFRVPGGEFWQQVLAGANQPIFGSSLNKHGEPEMKELAELIDFKSTLPDNILIFFEPLSKNPASTIVEVTSQQGQEELKIIREGAVSLQEINSCLKD